MFSKQNKIYRLLSILLALLLYSSLAFTQNKTIDSLKKVLLIQKEDTNKINTLYQLSKQFILANDYNSSLQYGIQSLKLAEKEGYKKGIGNGYWSVIASFHFLSDYNNYIEYTIKALKYFEKTGDLNEVGYYLQIMSSIHETMGDTTEAFSNLFASLKIREQIDDKWGIIQSTNTIGLLYCGQGKYEDALEKHYAALKICESLPGKKGYENMFAFTYQCIGITYERLGDEAYKKNERDIAEAEYKKVLQQYQLSYNEWRGINSDDGMAGLNYYMGNVYVKLKKYKLADDLLQKSLHFYLESGNNENMDAIYLSLSQIDSAKGNYKKAYENYKQHILYKEATVSKDLIRKVESNKGKNEFEKKETELKLLSTESKLQTILAKEQQQKKNIAYAGIGLILLGGGYGFYRFRKRKSIQSKEALTNERLRISQELHDEVGATLSGISMYSHLTKEQIKHAQTDEVEKSLNIMQQSAGDMVNKLNDIVWFINPDQDTLQKLMQRLEEYAGDMAAIKNMQVKISVPTAFSTKSLPVESRRNIYLFCKEAINNAVKYSEANLLQLSVKENNHLLEIIISDNGKGFDLDAIKRGNGLNNMQKRSDELGADFSIESKPHEGCLISLRVKIT